MRYFFGIRRSNSHRKTLLKIWKKQNNFQVFRSFLEFLKFCESCSCWPKIPKTIFAHSPHKWLQFKLSSGIFDLSWAEISKSFGRTDRQTDRRTDITTSWKIIIMIIFYSCCIIINEMYQREVHALNNTALSHFDYMWTYGII